MPSALDDGPKVAGVGTMSERVFAEAQRSLAPEMDVAALQNHVDEVISLLWTESTTVTTFIPLLALRELRSRLANERGDRHM